MSATCMFVLMVYFYTLACVKKTYFHSATLSLCEGSTFFVFLLFSVLGWCQSPSLSSSVMWNLHY